MRKQSLHEEEELGEKLNGGCSKLRVHLCKLRHVHGTVCNFVFRKIQVQGKDGKR